MKYLNVIIIVFSAFVVVAFFLPWTKCLEYPAYTLEGIAAASLDGPSSSAPGPGIINKMTGFFKGLFGSSGLNNALPCYRIPLSGHKAAKQTGDTVYLLYALPVIAVLCACFALMSGSQKKLNAFIFIMAVIVFYLLYVKVAGLNEDGFLDKVELMGGFWITLYAFLGIGIASFMKLVLPVKFINKAERRKRAS